MNHFDSLYQPGSYINGQWHTSKDNLFEIKNPATGEVVDQLANANSIDANNAVEAAYLALPCWREKPAKERANLLRKVV